MSGYVQAQTEKPCRILGNSTPPLHTNVNGVLTGFSIDLLSVMFDRQGRLLHTCDLIALPFVRGLEMLKERPNQIMVGVARTEDRETNYKWVGPYFNVSMSLIAKKEHQIQVRYLTDLVAYRIGTLRGSAPEAILLKSGLGESTLTRVGQPRQGLLMLMADRVDIMAHVFLPFTHELQAMNRDPADYEEVFLLDTVELYFALPVLDSNEMVDQLQETLEEIQAEDGYLYNALLSRYGMHSSATGIAKAVR